MLWIILQRDRGTPISPSQSKYLVRESPEMVLLDSPKGLGLDAIEQPPTPQVVQHTVRQRENFRYMMKLPYLVATCLHSQEMLPMKHWTSAKEVQEIESRGGLVLYEVDVSIMNKHPDLKECKFDIIIFNFPHVGHLSWLSETWFEVSVDTPIYRPICNRLASSRCKVMGNIKS